MSTFWAHASKALSINSAMAAPVLLYPVSLVAAMNVCTATIGKVFGRIQNYQCSRRAMSFVLPLSFNLHLCRCETDMQNFGNSRCFVGHCLIAHKFVQSMAEPLRPTLTFGFVEGLCVGGRI